MTLCKICLLCFHTVLLGVNYLICVYSLYLMVLLSEVLGGSSLLLAVADSSCGLFSDCEFIFSV